MKAFVTFQDSHDPEDCEVWVNLPEMVAVPRVGDKVCLIPEAAEAGTLFEVTEVLWTVTTDNHYDFDAGSKLSLGSEAEAFHASVIVTPVAEDAP